MTETVAGLACVEFGDDTLLREPAEVPAFTAFRRMASSPRGLTEPGTADRLRRFGDNEPFHLASDKVGARIITAVRSPYERQEST